MKYRIIHISHTDVRFDSRILKEIKCLSRVPNFDVVGLGIEDSPQYSFNSSSDLNLINLKLRSKKLFNISKYIRYLLIYFETFLKIVILGKRYKPHVIHCHDVLILPIGIVIKLLCGSRLIYDAHELESQKNLLFKNILLSL